MICQTCKEVLTVRDGTGMVEPDAKILNAQELEICAKFLLDHEGHRGVGLCLFEVKEVAQA